MIGALYPGLYAIDAYVVRPNGILAPRINAIGVRGGQGDAAITFHAPALYAARGTTGAGSSLTLDGPTLNAIGAWKGAASITFKGPKLDTGGVSVDSGRVVATFWVEAELSSGTWSTLPVLAAEPVTWRLGMGGGGPDDRVATTGECHFALRNDNHDGLPMGYYSPDAPQCRPGWAYGVSIRVRGYYEPRGGIDTLFTGRLHTVTPSPGQHRDRHVACVVLDNMNALAETDARNIPPQVNQSENALLVTILNTLPTSAWPQGVWGDPSLDVYPYALDNAAENVLALSLIADVVKSAQGYFFAMKNGILRFQNREARPSGQSVCTFTDDSLVELEVPSDLSGVYNDIRVVIHPRTFSDQPVVLYAITRAPVIDPGAIIELWGDYRDPTNDLQLVGGINMIAPVAYVDYHANSAPDGSGVDITGSVQVTAEPFAASVKFTIANHSTTYSANLVDSAGEGHLQIRGTAVYDVEALTYTAVASTTPAYGAQVLSLDLAYQHDGWTAQALADRLLAQYQHREDQIAALSFDAHRNATLMLQALTGEVGQIVTVSESVTGVANVPVAIQAMEYTLTAGQWLSVRYVTAPQGPPLPAPLPSQCTYTGPTSGSVAPGQAIGFSTPGVYTLQFTQAARVVFQGAAGGAAGHAPNPGGNGGGGGGTGAYDQGTPIDVKPHTYYTCTVGGAGVYPQGAGGDTRVEKADGTAVYLHLEGGQPSPAKQGGAGGRALVGGKATAGVAGGSAGIPPTAGGDDGFSGSGGGGGDGNYGGVGTWGADGGRNGEKGGKPGGTPRPETGYGDGGGQGGKGGGTGYAFGGGGAGAIDSQGSNNNPGSSGGPGYLAMYW